MMSTKSLRRKWSAEQAARREFLDNCVNIRFEPQPDGTIKQVRWTYKDGDLA